MRTQLFWRLKAGLSVLLCWFLALALLSACSLPDSDSTIACRITRTPEPADSPSQPALTQSEAGLSVKAAKGEGMSILYEITMLPAQTIVSVSFDMTLSAAAEVGDIALQELRDPNTAYLTPGIRRTTEDTYSVKQLVRTDTDGTLRLRLTLTCTGDVTIPDPTLRAVESDRDYVICTDPSGITLVLLEADRRTEDITRDELAAMATGLAQCDSALRHLTGETDALPRVFVFTEACAVTALAGDPIYVDRRALGHLFSEEASADIEKTSGLAVLCHELSHTYDREEYTFDREFFAALKQYYALLDSGCAVTPAFFSDKPRPSSGAYNYEAVLRTLLERTPLSSDPTAWTVVRDTLDTMRGDPYLAYTAVEKFTIFNDRLSAALGQALFTEEELSFLVRYYATK